MGTGGAYKFPEEARLGEDASFAGSSTCIRMSRVRRNSKRGLVVQSQKVISRNFHESRSAELTRALGVGYGWVKKIPATVVPPSTSWAKDRSRLCAIFLVSKAFTSLRTRR